MGSSRYALFPLSLVRSVHNAICFLPSGVWVPKQTPAPECDIATV
jgi:hypothetical protein